MSLSIRERLILRRIEQELRSGDPRLAALLESHGAEPPASQEPPTWLLMGFVLCVIAAAVMLNRFSPAPGSWYPQSASSSAASADSHDGR
ncbi:DUF3040 domain-containing protein [Actinomadura verrucosospora]|uniref:DUF3040 domain-containing protein n=1 Tax=Actinomadura verrucosospora TaxID=46165 RepID=A0A7D3VQX3_ACTVE|nr:DUF3040 domain-containing protein [Actinomadura verrucosospora]QKG20758.1 hypothetical protein ACTIVE_2396 [Actinomadura verrucosospora]